MIVPEWTIQRPRPRRGETMDIKDLNIDHERLAEICRPDMGIITNIGRAHLEGVGSIDGVMRAKGELLEKIKAMK